MQSRIKLPREAAMRALALIVMWCVAGHARGSAR